MRYTTVCWETSTRCPFSSSEQMLREYMLLSYRLLSLKRLLRSPCMRAKYSHQRVCMFVCLSIRWHILETTYPNFTKFSLHIFVHTHTQLWPWLDSPLKTMRYVMYFRFCGWRHAFNGKNRPESKTTRFILSVLPGAGTSRTSDNVVWSRLPGGRTVGEVCRLRLYFVCSVCTTSFLNFVLCILL